MLQDFFHAKPALFFGAKKRARLVFQNHGEAFLMREAAGCLGGPWWDLGDRLRCPVAEWVWGSWLIIYFFGIVWNIWNISTWGTIYELICFDSSQYIFLISWKYNLTSRCLWSWEFEFHNLKPIVCFDLLSKLFTTLWFEPLSISRRNALLLMSKFKVYDSELNLRHIIFQYLLVYVSYGHWSRFFRSWAWEPQYGHRLNIGWT